MILVFTKVMGIPATSSSDQPTTRGLVLSPNRASTQEPAPVYGMKINGQGKINGRGNTYILVLKGVVCWGRTKNEPVKVGSCRQRRRFG